MWRVFGMRVRGTRGGGRGVRGRLGGMGVVGHVWLLGYLCYSSGLGAGRGGSLLGGVVKGKEG